MVKLSINICGGLGNQLFQMFSLLKVCKDQSLEYEILQRDESPSITPRRTYWNDFFKNLNLVQEESVKYENFNEENNNVYKPLPKFEKDTKLNGYFQAWDYISDLSYFDYIGLKEEDERKVLEVYQNLKKDGKKLIFVHIRHGDYIRLSYCHYVLPLEYYISALKYFDEDTTKFVFFSDDLEYCKINFKFLKDKEFVNLGDHLELYLMSMMDGAVIANSSFSLWGAILLEHKKKLKGDKMEKIIQPSRWFTFGNPFPNDRIFKKEGWIKLEF